MELTVVNKIDIETNIQSIKTLLSDTCRRSKNLESEDVEYIYKLLDTIVLPELGPICKISVKTNIQSLKTLLHDISRDGEILYPVEFEAIEEFLDLILLICVEG